MREEDQPPLIKIADKRDMPCAVRAHESHLEPSAPARERPRVF